MRGRDRNPTRDTHHPRTLTHTLTHTARHRENSSLTHSLPLTLRIHELSYSCTTRAHDKHARTPLACESSEHVFFESVESQCVQPFVREGRGCKNDNNNKLGRFRGGGGGGRQSLTHVR